MTLGEINAQAFSDALMRKVRDATRDVQLNRDTNGSTENYIIEMVTAQVLLYFAGALVDARMNTENATS